VKSLNCKIWILTGDTKELAIGTGIDANIIDKELDERMEITAENEENLVVCIRGILNEIK